MTKTDWRKAAGDNICWRRRVFTISIFDDYLEDEVFLQTVSKSADSTVVSGEIGDFDRIAAGCLYNWGAAYVFVDGKNVSIFKSREDALEIAGDSLVWRIKTKDEN